MENTRSIIIFSMDDSLECKEFDVNKLDKETGKLMEIKFINGLTQIEDFIEDGNVSDDAIFYHIVPRNGIKTILDINGVFSKFAEANTSLGSGFDIFMIDIFTIYSKCEDMYTPINEINEKVKEKYPAIKGIDKFGEAFHYASYSYSRYQDLLYKAVEKFGYDTTNHTIKYDRQIEDLIHAVMNFVEGNITRVLTLSSEVASLFNEVTFDRCSNRLDVREKDYDEVQKEINTYPGIRMCVVANPFSLHVLNKLKENAKEPEKIYIDRNMFPIAK